jgi:hypothetical protein
VSHVSHEADSAVAGAARLSLRRACPLLVFRFSHDILVFNF